MEYRPIPNLDKYEISRCGDVRNRRTGNAPCCDPKGRFVLLDGKKQIRKSAADLLEMTFNIGPDGIETITVQEWFEFMKANFSEKSI